MIDSEILESYGLKSLPVRHPKSGAEFVDANVRSWSDDKRVSYGPPMRPVQDWEEYDDDGLVVAFGRHSDDAFAEIMRKYDAGLEEWRRLGGSAYVRGRTTYQVTMRCANGDSAEFLSTANSDWRCVRANWRSKPSQ